MAWGQWPAYVDRAPRVRTLAGWNIKDGDPTAQGILTEDAQIFYPTSWEDLKAIVCDNDLDLCVDDFGKFPWINEAIADPKTTATLRRDYSLGGFEVRQGRKRRWIGPLGTWGIHSSSMASLLMLRALMDHMGVDTRPSPAAIGQAVMRKSFNKAGHRPRRVPNRHIRKMLEDHGVGGRSDTFVRPDQQFEEVYEVDLNDAYLRRMIELPDGTPTFWQEPDDLVEQVDDHSRLTKDGLAQATWIGAAVVHIPEGCELGFGPFPVRTPGGETSYPTEPGWYGHEGEETVYLWKQEVEQAIEAGCLVWLRGEQWSWPRFTESMRGAAMELVALRETASPEIQSLVKLCIVAGIGWFGQRPTRIEAVPEPVLDDPQGVRVGVAGTGAEVATFYVKEARKESLPYLSHWYWYNIMKVRQDVLDMARTAELKGMVVRATNFDAIFVTVGMYGVLGKGEARHVKGRPVPLPDFSCFERPFKVNKLTTVRFPYVRAVVSDQKVRLPGVARTPCQIR